MLPKAEALSPVLSDVSRETLEKLRAYQAALAAWSRAINLIAPANEEEIWTRHIEDSAQLFFLAPRARTWCDLGAGGGLPGIVVAILASELNPACKLSLIESDKRKAAFLKIQAASLSLNVSILSERIETAPPQRADVVSARALAPLQKLLGHAYRHANPDTGIAILPKGKNAQAEIESARGVYSFDLTTIPNRTDPSGSILLIQNLHPKRPVA